jgi:hypothetical protein
MTTSQDRIIIIKGAIKARAELNRGAPLGAPETQPTQDEIDAGFTVAKAAILAMVSQLVPPWAQNIVNITDDEIHAVSDPVVAAALNS